ncbi:MAG: HigA family addiction module antidote protein [Firmicutes bacterium]|nr:HigA family addiction module antidote protein [Bacillota bacterium]
MSNITEYKDIVAFHPGYYLADIIEDMEISQAEFAARLGTTAKTLSQLLSGQANISNDLAKKLSVMMGTSAEVWQRLQNTYDQKLIEIQQAKDFDEQKEVMKQIDYMYFVDVVGLPRTRIIEEKIVNLCSFFKVSDLRIMLRPDFLVNFRSGTSDNTEKKIINSRAWIQTAMNMAKSIETKPYDAQKLKAYLPELRSMTVQDPEVFLPRMREIFAECGVAFVLLPHLKNSGVNGAVKWVNNERVVLAMNNRGLDADKFWFSLFHEIKHVFQQKIKTVFISSSVEEMVDYNNALEDDADKFASNYLIPLNELRRFAPTKYTSDNEIVEFAKSIGIHPGIVAGRLQHEKIIPQSRCSKLKEKYTIDIKRLA